MTRRKSASELRAREEELLIWERKLWAEGYVHIAGVDEAGVGPLAGPVCAGAAILPREYHCPGLDDSKKIPSAARREALAAAVKRDALAWAVGWASPAEIDKLNIFQASLLAMRRAVDGLQLAPEVLLVDARRIPELTIPQHSIIGGDGQSLSIAAGAILAKTSRDARMLELEAQYPGYGLAVHKGYPTAAHLDALRRLGATPIHRQSYAPVRAVLEARDYAGPGSAAESTFQSVP